MATGNVRSQPKPKVRLLRWTCPWCPTSRYFPHATAMVRHMEEAHPREIGLTDGRRH